MTGVLLTKIFAWVIGVLALLWLLAECVGGPDPADDPSEQEIQRDAEQYAQDCQNTWEALALTGEADHESAEFVVDEIETIASDIEDPELSAMAYSFAGRVEDVVAGTETGDTEELQESLQLYRGLVEVDLSLRCAGTGVD
ncbi:hypothetical protein L0U85_05805 [Glycomyces sp. L485]|uniref:hypothetical protein n=1 Tax=Glycomyces sp. L485 TaxID=2909235 RepID=UPI001F4A8ABA|nr:hypothetical protein [Glycomyces sp. L485]MCH7230373.1 hypothetical protein [Glycomyces sp. L485]